MSERIGRIVQRRFADRFPVGALEGVDQVARRYYGRPAAYTVGQERRVVKIHVRFGDVGMRQDGFRVVLVGSEETLRIAGGRHAHLPAFANGVGIRVGVGIIAAVQVITHQQTLYELFVETSLHRIVLIGQVLDAVFQFGNEERADGSHRIS